MHRIVGAVTWVMLCVLLAAGAGGESVKHGRATSEAIATIDGRVITEADINEKWAGAIRQARANLYEVQRRAAQEVIGGVLLEREAKRRGISLQEFLDTEVYAKVGEIPPEDVKSLYFANAARIQEPFEKVAPQLERYLREQRAESWRVSLVSRLEKSARIEFLIEPSRVKVSAQGPSQGSPTAPVTIVEFADFQCPFCARAVPVLKQILERDGDRVRLVYRDFPIEALHPYARKAAEAARCASEQGKFWDYHDKLFASQSALDREALERYAADLQLDSKTFAGCLASDKYREAIDQDIRDGEKAGVGATPTFFVNGRLLVGVPSAPVIQSMIDEELQRTALRIQSKGP